MRPFLVPKRKLLDLGILLVLSLVFFILQGIEATVLFTFGFIWNWVASQDLSLLMEGRRYRFSMVRFVLNIQNLITSPAFIIKSPEFVKIVFCSLPAGLFWWMVIIFNESTMPVWSTFVGSLCFEISQLQIFVKKSKDANP